MHFAMSEPALIRTPGPALPPARRASAEHRSLGEDGWIRLAGLVLILFLARCGVRRPYQAPVPMAPEVWSEQGAAVAADVEALAQWWETFGDPVLTSLVRRAIKVNLDVRASLSRWREARASVSSARASLNPVVDASGTMVATGRRDEVLGSVTTRSYSVAFDASWELDVFGGIGSTIDAAAATAEARAADLQDVLISLTAEVAIDYVDVRTLQRRLEIALANANVQEQTLELAQFRAQAGLATDLDVQQALSNLEST